MDMLWVSNLTVWIFLSLHKVNTLSVTITKTDESPGEIEIKDGVKELRVASGDDIGLKCTVKGVESDFSWAIWSGDDKTLTFRTQLLATQKARYRIDETRSRTGDPEYTLSIQNVLLKDQGNYTCEVPEGLKDRVQLFVTTRPNITMITGLQTARVGDNVRLQCLSDGSPTPAVTWRHVRPNHILPNGIMGSYKQSQILDIKNIQIKDRGEYQCLATNGVQRSDLSAKRTSFIRMNYAPTVEPVLDDFSAMKALPGAEVSVICKSLAYPRSSASDVQWFYEDALSASDKEIVNGNNGYRWAVAHQLPTEDVDPYEETTFSTLQISEVSNNTIGEYRCQFRNSEGNKDARIVVEFAPQEGGAFQALKSKASHTTCSIGSVLVTLLVILRIIYS